VQLFIDQYSVDFPGMKKSMLGNQHALCTVCRADINISHGGANDITKHMKSDKHKRNAGVVTSNKSISAMFARAAVNDISRKTTHAEISARHSRLCDCQGQVDQGAGQGNFVDRLPVDKRFPARQQIAKIASDNRYHAPGNTWIAATWTCAEFRECRLLEIFFTNFLNSDISNSN